jgi:hypothetical protein
MTVEMDATIDEIAMEILLYGMKATNNKVKIIEESNIGIITYELLSPYLVIEKDIVICCDKDGLLLQEIHMLSSFVLANIESIKKITSNCSPLSLISFRDGSTITITLA